MSATNTQPTGPTTTNSRARMKLIIALVLAAAFGSLSTCVFMITHPPVPQALPAQVYTNANPLATAVCGEHYGDQAYYLASINSTTPAMQMDGDKQVTGKYRITSSARFDENGLASEFIITVDSEVPIDAVYVYNNTDAAPTTTALRTVVLYVVPKNSGVLVLQHTKPMSFSANTHAFVCMPSDPTGR